MLEKPKSPTFVKIEIQTMKLSIIPDQKRLASIMKYIMFAERKSFDGNADLEFFKLPGDDCSPIFEFVVGGTNKFKHSPNRGNTSVKQIVPEAISSWPLLGVSLSEIPNLSEEKEPQNKMPTLTPSTQSLNETESRDHHTLAKGRRFAKAMIQKMGRFVNRTTHFF